MRSPGPPSTVERPLVLVALESSTRNLSLTAEQGRRIAGEFSQWDFEFLSNSKDLVAHLGRAQVILTWEFKSEWYKKAQKLRAIFTPAAGKDWVQADPVGRVPVFRGQFHGMAISQYLLAMMLRFNLRLDALGESQRNRIWDRNSQQDASLLRGQTVILIGYGAIGRHCAQALAPFGCEIVGVKRSPPPDGRDDYARRIITIERMDELLPAADHIAAVLPADPSTDHIITRDRFAAMNKACFYNMGRGNCYREEDLLWALDNCKIRKAALDVFAVEPLSPDSRLWTIPKVELTPHTSALTREYMDLFVDELLPRLRQIQDQFRRG